MLALIPLDTPPSMPGTDKLHHFIAFAILTLPCAILHVRALPWALPAFILEAGLIEIVQPYANRFREWADFTADLKGIAIGLALGLAIRSIGLVTSRKSERRR